MMSKFFHRIPTFFTLFFAVFFAFSAFFLIDSFRMYRAEATLVVLSKSPAAFPETVAGNFATLVGTLPFYERILSDYESASDPWETLSRTEREDAWSRVIDARVEPGTSLLALSVSSRESEQASSLLAASIETLYGFSARLYDRENEADIRLVDPVSVRAVVSSPVALVLVSAFLSAALALLASLILRTIAPSFGAPALHFSTTSDTKGIHPIGSFTKREEAMESEPIVERKQKEQEDLKLAETMEPVSSRETLLAPESENLNTSEMTVETTVSSREESVLAPSTFEATQVVEEAPSAPDEPADIWEQSYARLRGEFRIETPRAETESLPPLSHRESSIETEQPTKVEETVSNPAPEEKVSVSPSVEATHSATPGNLESIPASDFSWEKFLFNGKDGNENAATFPTAASSGKTFEAESAVSISEERREPTPEELKARLNELLRGGR